MTNHDVLARLAAVDTAAVSDALDRYGLPSGVGGLRALTIDRPVVGYARTATLEPYEEGVPGPHILTGVVDASGPHDVIVIDNGGRTDVSAWGGILGVGAVARGVRGVVVDGAFRDVDENRELGLPVYARSTSPATARGRLRQRAAAEPVRIAGRTVRDGDLIRIDATGLVVVPLSLAEAVLDEAEAVVAREKQIIEEVRAGARLSRSMGDARLAGEQEDVA